MSQSTRSLSYRLHSFRKAVAKTVEIGWETKAAELLRQLRQDHGPEYARQLIANEYWNQEGGIYAAS